MDYGKGKEEQRDAEPSTEDLFRYLDSQIPWPVSEEGLRYERCVFALMSFGSSYNDATLSMGSAWAVCIPTSKSASALLFKLVEAC